MSTVANQDIMNDTATYWAEPTDNGYGGLTFAASSEISCRWEDNQERFLDVDGNERLSRAVVYPDQSVAIGGWLFEGSSGASDPRTVTGAFEIQQVRAIKSMGGQLIEYKVML